MEYQLVTGPLRGNTEKPSISSIVRSLIDEGWSPQGGVCVVNSSFVAQAMVKSNANEKERDDAGK